MGQIDVQSVAAVIVLGVLGPGLAASGAPPGPRRTTSARRGATAGPAPSTPRGRRSAEPRSRTSDPATSCYLQGGATFTGTLQLTAEDSGTSANPVIIDSYGTGRATISSGTAKGVSVYNASGVVVRNLQVVGAGP